MFYWQVDQLVLPSISPTGKFQCRIYKDLKIILLHAGVTDAGNRLSLDQIIVLPFLYLLFIPILLKQSNNYSFNNQ